MISSALKKQFGDIDIHLFDQLLKGRLDSTKTILDAGCGSGRNLQFLLHNNFNVYGIDKDPAKINYITKRYDEIENFNSSNFCTATLDNIPFPDKMFDFIICNAVLHFAESENQFELMFSEFARILKNSGILFIRTASSRGIENDIRNINGRIFQLGDGTKRFLIDNSFIQTLSEKFGLQFVDDIKNTVVSDVRSMATIILKK